MQKRKTLFQSADSMTYRIVTADKVHTGARYEVAEGNDFDSMFQNEWRYLCETLPSQIPACKPEDKWHYIIAHLTRIAVNELSASGKLKTAEAMSSNPNSNSLSLDPRVGSAPMSPSQLSSSFSLERTRGDSMPSYAPTKALPSQSSSPVSSSSSSLLSPSLLPAALSLTTDASSEVSSSTAGSALESAPDTNQSHPCSTPASDQSQSSSSPSSLTSSTITPSPATEKQPIPAEPEATKTPSKPQAPLENQGSTGNPQEQTQSARKEASDTGRKQDSAPPFAPAGAPAPPPAQTPTIVASKAPEGESAEVQGSKGQKASKNNSSSNVPPATAPETLISTAATSNSLQPLSNSLQPLSNSLQLLSPLQPSPPAAPVAEPVAKNESAQPPNALQPKPKPAVTAAFLVSPAKPPQKAKGVQPVLCAPAPASAPAPAPARAPAPAPATAKTRGPAAPVPLPPPPAPAPAAPQGQGLVVFSLDRDTWLGACAWLGRRNRNELLVVYAVANLILYGLIFDGRILMLVANA
jgi:hypothetical protein